MEEMQRRRGEEGEKKNGEERENMKGRREIRRGRGTYKKRRREKIGRE